MQPFFAPFLHSLTKYRKHTNNNTAAAAQRIYRECGEGVEKEENFLIPLSIFSTALIILFVHCIMLAISFQWISLIPWKFADSHSISWKKSGWRKVFEGSEKIHFIAIKFKIFSFFFYFLKKNLLVLLCNRNIFVLIYLNVNKIPISFSLPKWNQALCTYAFVFFIYSTRIACRWRRNFHFFKLETIYCEFASLACVCNRIENQSKNEMRVFFGEFI